MYSWKDTDSAVSAAADRGKAALASGCLSGRPARTEEEEDGAGVDGGEETDAFAPLPSELSSTAKQFGKSAKDKRRLREKRRSTGVATLEGQQVSRRNRRGGRKVGCFWTSLSGTTP